MTPYVVLLRGINVGPTTQVPMPRLQEVVSALGFSGVRTYIRSGNIVLGATDREDPAGVRRRIEQAIETELGARVDVVVRTGEAMREVLQRCPFPEAEPAHLGVAFLAESPSNALLARMGRVELGDDAYAVDGHEIYLHLPHGFGRSRLATTMHALKAPDVGTVRNWRTVRRLTEMAQALEV